jgi:hypothetical protein
VGTETGQLPMQQPRWYPSSLPLPNGTFALLSGTNDSTGFAVYDSLGNKVLGTDGVPLTRSVLMPTVEIIPANGNKPVTIPLFEQEGGALQYPPSWFNEGKPYRSGGHALYPFAHGIFHCEFIFK